MIELAKLCSALCSAVVLGGGVAVLALSLAAKLGGWAETGMLWPATDAAADQPVSAAAHGLAEIRDLLRRSASATAPSPAASPKAGPGKARVPA